MSDLAQWVALKSVLTVTDIIVSGDWVPGPKRDWQGLACSQRTLASVVFMRTVDGIAWSKSERPTIIGHDVRLLLGQCENGNLDLYATFSAGDGQQQTLVRAPSDDYRPEMPARITAQTGSIVPVCTLATSPEVEFSVLFIDGADVQVGRNGLWHVRPRIAEKIDEPMRSVLTCGRTGGL
jgi:hypothetical protein